MAQGCRVADLNVTIKDSQGGLVFDAKVWVTSGDREVATKQSQSTGTANFTGIPCGPVTVYASKSGFSQERLPMELTATGLKDLTVTLVPEAQQATIEVKEAAPLVEQSSSNNNELPPQEAKRLPNNPATLSETLPLAPGITRGSNGELNIDGAGEQRSALVVNQSDVTDPATGKFTLTVPVDSIETINVLRSPFLAQYGRFTQSVIAVETKRGGEKWHAELNDPFPDFRIRSYHMRGILNEAPRFVVGGPLISGRLYFNTALQYLLDKVQSRTLGFPFNTSKMEKVNSFTQLDWIASSKQVITLTFHLAPQHTNFVDPDYFHPQPTTPSYAQHNYLGTIADHYGLFGGTLDSSLSMQRFDGSIGAQGSLDYILTPEGNQGNYFGRQYREARRTEWVEIWSPTPRRALGTHQLKLGNSLTGGKDFGRFTFRPVAIYDSFGTQIESIRYSNPAGFDKKDLEETAYIQDHWIVNSRISLDYGLRIEHQQLASSLRYAPRGGVAWTPFSDGNTVFRAGWGQFYDHIPFDVYTFDRYPRRTITQYAPDGSVLGVPQTFINVIGSITGPRSFLIRGQQVAGEFSPRGATWNAELEHRFSDRLRVRAAFSNNRSVGLLVLEPQLRNQTNEIVLNGSGSSRYRQLEITAKLTLPDRQILNFTYTNSKARGTINDFDSFLGNFPLPLIRPNQYSNLPGDVPNRFLVWGNVKTHFQGFEVFPIVEYRSGFLYSHYDASQNYFGLPYSDTTRFRNFLSADARLMRDFKVNPKYTLRLSVTGFNLTNHFNPLAVHNNVDDPGRGIFFGNYKRRYRFDFEVLF